MKKFCTILFALSASLCLFVSCEEEPVASFSVSSTLVGTNQNVSFTNTSVDADNFEWYFGDGASSTEANPTHSYSKQGNYIVTLIAYSKSGRMLDDAYKAYIWVLDPYKVVFHNPTYTPIRITVTDYGTQTIPIDGSTIFEVYTSTPSFTASATETFSNGNPLALTVSWQGTLDLTSPTSDINLNIGTNIFYLYTKNTSGYDLGPIYSNYGTSYQVYINALLPTSIATWYGLGYHHARYNTQIRWYYSSTYYYYATAGTDFSFPDTNNQSLAITVGSKSNEIGVEKQSHGTDLNTAFEFKTFQDTKNTSVKILGSIDIFPVNQ